MIRLEEGAEEAQADCLPGHTLALTLGTITLGRLPGRALPRPASFDLGFEREAQERPDQHDAG